MKILDESYYDDLLKDLEEIFREQQKDVIAIICARLRAVGQLNPTSAKQLARMAKYQNADLKEIEKVIKKASRMAEKEIDTIFEQAAETSREYAEVLAHTAGGGTYEANFQTLMSAAAREYKDMVLNLSETYAFKTDGKVLSIRQQYIKAVNRAVSAVSTGTLDYNTAIRQTVKQMVDSGLRTRQRTGEKVLEWPESGYTRRADSSVRMNVLEGVRRMNQAVLDDAAEKYATGYEISAHDRPAPDHADIQGRQYTRADYENLNASLARPIGTLNCMHIAFPIIYGVSKPAYTEEQLANMKHNAEQEYTWKGKKLTGYECTQMQRKYETAIRRTKEQEVAFKAAGNDLDAKRARRNAWHLTEEYREFSDHVGLSVKENRARNITGQQKNSFSTKKSEKTLAKSEKVQYTSSPPDELLKQYEKDVQEGWVSPLCGFENYERQYNRIQQEIVGKTVSGGITITGQKPHFMQRVIGTMVDPKILKEELRVVRRSGVEVDAIKAALFEPEMVDKIVTRPSGKRSQRFIGRDCIVTINPDTGMLIQTNPI